MRNKILLLLVIIGAIFASSTVGTLSSYTVQSSFGIDVVANSHGSHHQIGSTGP